METTLLGTGHLLLGKYFGVQGVALKILWKLREWPSKIFLIILTGQVGNVSLSHIDHPGG